MSLCACACVCVIGENWKTTESRNRSLRWEEAASSLIESESVERDAEDRERERARQWKSARFCSDVDVFVGNSGLYAYAIIMKERSIVQFVFVFLSAAADLIWIRFKSSQALYCCCCFFVSFAQKLFNNKLDEPQTLFGPGEWRNLIKF